MSTNTAKQKRQPAGRPIGGQYAAEPKAGAGVSLDEPTPQVTGRGDWEDTDDGEDEYYVESQRVLETNEAFNTRVRMLLGVSDPQALVTVAEAESSVSPRECDTCWESNEWVEVSAGDQSRCFESLPELLAHLEFADREPLDDETIFADLGREADWVTKDRRGGVHRFRGRIGNARGSTVVIMVPGPREDNWRLPDTDRFSSNSKETLIRTDLRTILAMDVDYDRATCMHCKQTVTDPGEVADQRCTSCTDERRCAGCGTYSSILDLGSHPGLCGACDRRESDRELEADLRDSGLSEDEVQSIVGETPET